MYQGIRNKINYNSNEFKEERKINIKKFFELKSIMIYILSILVGTCKLSSGATPFGLALLGAIADVNFPLIIPWILIGTSTCIKFGWTCLLKFVISSLIFIISKSFLRGNTKTGNAAKILFSTAISEIIILLMSETLIYDAVMAAFMSTTTAIFYLIFSEGLPVILDFRAKKIDSHETLMAAGILISALITGIGDIGIFGLSIRGIVCVLIVLLMGWKRGATCRNYIWCFNFSSFRDNGNRRCKYCCYICYMWASIWNIFKVWKSWSSNRIYYWKCGLGLLY